ncbi:MAG: hypothetical protein N3A38_05035 [Planctomycetota bacterium]|nr:hypothetical protein [Planctomycetota bacterium]
MIAMTCGCGRTPRTNDYADLEPELRIPAMFRVEAEEVEEMLADLRLRLTEPRSRKEPSAVLVGATKARETWRRVAAHFAAGVNVPEKADSPGAGAAAAGAAANKAPGGGVGGADPEAHGKWTAAANGVSVALEDARRHIGEGNFEAADYSLWQAGRCMDVLWERAGFGDVPVACIRLRSLIAAVRWWPFERRDKVAPEMRRRILAALRRVMESAMGGIGDKEEAASRMAILARLRTASDSFLDALAVDSRVDTLLDRSKVVFGALSDLERHVAERRAAGR